jgi:uncharacterized protein (TIGR02145 family)
MKQKTFFLALTLFVLSAASVNAQVTIGSNQEPHGGAVLDLSKANGNSIGFLLPRISLENITVWQIGGEKAAGIGMMVYNINDKIVGGIGSGIYIWNGSTWTPIKSNDCSNVTDYEGNTYLAAQFGAAGCWMTENLRSKVYSSDGTPLPVGFDAKVASKFYYYPGANEQIFTSHPEYGLLYTWVAATDRPATDMDEAYDSPDQTQYQGICPSGWHLPSDYEWNQLEEAIATSAAGVYSTTAATTWDISYRSNQAVFRGEHGRKMKSTTMVNNTPTDGTSNASHSRGFNALLSGGWLATKTSSDEYGLHASFWTSTAGMVNRDLAYIRWSSNDNVGVHRQGAAKQDFFSVRCKKD